jgi:hypothetical protein
MAHRTVRCATGHCPVRLPRHQAVGFRPLELLSSRPPDGCCSLSGAPSVSALTLARTVAHLMPSANDRWREVAVAPLAHQTVRCYTRLSGELYRSGLQNSRRWAVRSWSPWCTEQSGAPDQGTLRLSFALYIWILFWSFYWFVVNLWHL